MRALIFLVGIFAACDSSNTAQNGDGSNNNNNPDGFVALDDLAVDRDAFFIQDPPVMYCGLDGGAFTPPTPPGGTLACPDDKNLEGCPCPTLGMTASCWPGKRANRGLGQCKDGQTTCVQSGEVNTAWGPCVGAVLPTAGATQGAAACDCFSEGFWDIADIVVCGSI